MEVWNEDSSELEIGRSVESFQKFLASQKELFHSQIDQFQDIVVTQCKLTGVNPLSQEMVLSLSLYLSTVHRISNGQLSNFLWQRMHNYKFDYANFVSNIVVMFWQMKKKSARTCSPLRFVSMYLFMCSHSFEGIIRVFNRVHLSLFFGFYVQAAGALSIKIGKLMLELYLFWEDKINLHWKMSYMIACFIFLSLTLCTIFLIYFLFHITLVPLHCHWLNFIVDSHFSNVCWL